MPDRPAEVARPGEALTHTDIRVVGVGVKSRLDLNSIAVEAPAFESVAHVRDGELSLD